MGPNPFLCSGLSMVLQSLFAQHLAQRIGKQGNISSSVPKWRSALSVKRVSHLSCLGLPTFPSLSVLPLESVLSNIRRAIFELDIELDNFVAIREVMLPEY